MSRATSARRIAAAAAFGGGGIGALTAAMFGVIFTEVKLARKWIGEPFGKLGPGGAGLYGPASGDPLVLAMIGDSTSVGLGADGPERTPGVVLASGLANITGRPVRLVINGRVGAESAELIAQVASLLEETPKPDLVVIMVGANDVTHRRKPAEAVRHLSEAVRQLRDAGAQVVVGTCPDLGTIEPIAHPLRYIARRLSRQLAAAQTIAVVEAGGRTVSLGDLLGPEFAARPGELFSKDRYHPSGAGYARVAAAMLPSAAAALGYWPVDSGPQPDVRRGDSIDDIAHAAVKAVDAAGTEVSGIQVSGSDRGPRGRWAILRRRRTTPDGSRDEHERIEPGRGASRA